MWRNLSKPHWEDFRHFRHNRQEIHSIRDVFLKPTTWSGGVEATYRPLSDNLYYLAGRVVFHNNLAAYHVLSAIAYVFNGILLLVLSRRLLPDPWSLIPPVLFVSRIAHGQVVTYTSLFDTSSYVTFGLVGLLCLIDDREQPGRRDAVAAAAFGLGVLCKESGIVWPAVVAAHGWFFPRPRAWRRYLPAFAVMAAWAAAYPFILRRLYPEPRPPFRIDLRPAALLAHYGAYLLTFLNPLVPNVDPEKAGWGMPPRVVSWAESAVMMAIMAALTALLLVLVVLVRLRPSALGAPMRVATLGLAWFVIATSPFAVFADRLFMRYAYAGHAGLALSTGGLAAAIAQRWRARGISQRAVGGEGGIRTPGAG